MRSSTAYATIPERVRTPFSIDRSLSIIFLFSIDLIVRAHAALRNVAIRAASSPPLFLFSLCLPLAETRLENIQRPIIRTGTSSGTCPRTRSRALPNRSNSANARRGYLANCQRPSWTTDTLCDAIVRGVHRLRGDKMGDLPASSAARMHLHSRAFPPADVITQSADLKLSIAINRGVATRAARSTARGISRSSDNERIRRYSK